MKIFISIAVTLALAAGASGDDWGSPNPDLPQGGVALDLSVGGVVSGAMEDNQWHLIDFVSVGNGLTADGLNVTSDADVSGTNIGVALMSSVSSKITLQISYRYDSWKLEDIQYRSAGALTGSNLRLAPPNFFDSHAHSVGARVRLWFGTK